jgi:hypothetical protein
MLGSLFLVNSLLVGAVVASKSVILLHEHNFETVVSTFRYAAVLFHDSSSDSRDAIEMWENTAQEMRENTHAELAAVGRANL